MLAIDSNVWIYYLDSQTREHELVRRPVRSAIESRTVFMNGVVPLEVSHYLANCRQNGERFVQEFLGSDDVSVEPVDVRMVRRADELLRAYPQVGIGGRDALLLAAMERHGVTELWTHDEGLKRLGGRLDWLSVEDPAVAS